MRSARRNRSKSTQLVSTTILRGQCRVGQGASSRRAHHCISIGENDGGHASLCPPCSVWPALARKAANHHKQWQLHLSPGAGALLCKVVREAYLRAFPPPSSGVSSLTWAAVQECVAAPFHAGATPPWASFHIVLMAENMCPPRECETHGRVRVFTANISQVSPMRSKLYLLRRTEQRPRCLVAYIAWR
jgi:hypothetical protein